MIKKLKILGAFLVVLFGLLLGVSFMLPSEWRVERSIVIHAPTTAIYPLIANFKKGWPQWSAFDFEDPSIVYSYSGPDEGIGSTRTWVSKNMGNGSQTILNASIHSGIEFELTMIQPPVSLVGKIAMETLTDNTTKVTWEDKGTAPSGSPLRRYFGLFADKMLGKVFERSLETLKQKVEAGGSHPPNHNTE